MDSDGPFKGLSRLIGDRIAGWGTGSVNYDFPSALIFHTCPPFQGNAEEPDKFTGFRGGRKHDASSCLPGTRRDYQSFNTTQPRSYLRLKIASSVSNTEVRCNLR